MCPPRPRTNKDHVQMHIDDIVITNTLVWGKFQPQGSLSIDLYIVEDTTKFDFFLLDIPWLWSMVNKKNIDYLVHFFSVCLSRCPPGFHFFFKSRMTIVLYFNLIVVAWCDFTSFTHAQYRVTEVSFLSVCRVVR